MNLATPPEIVLSEALRRFSRAELAQHLGRDSKTIARWERVGLDRASQMALLWLLSQSSPAANTSGSDFTFIDLFAGIGGTRAGFERQGGRCVFTSEWDKAAQRTYCANFHVDEVHPLIGDIRAVTEAEAWDRIPNFDVLVAGFPCQPFSIAGVSKKNSLGRKHGFACDAQGTLFFEIAKILNHARPPAFLLENVKNLRSHDKGNTFKVIEQVLRDELGYKVKAMVIDAKGFVPQHRERIYIVGFKEEVGFDWSAFESPAANTKKLADILHPEDGSEEPEEPYTTGAKAKVAEKYTLSDKLWGYLQAYAKKHQSQGNGFGFGLVDRDDISRTLSARYYKDGSEILVYQGKRKNPRRLTPRECARLMGFDTPDHKYRIVAADTPAYKQFGNSVVVPVIAEIARIMKPGILSLKEGQAQSPLPLAA